jgi:hypothetical protein
MFYILEVNNSIFNIYNNLDGALVQLFKLSLLTSIVELKEFNDGCINGIYSMKNNKILYTSVHNKNIITIEYENIPFELLYKKNNIVMSTFDNNRHKQSSSEINVRLPPINTEINITTDSNKSNEIDNFENLDAEELKKKIDQLNKLKEVEMADLQGLNENLHEYENKIIEEKFNVDAEKNKLKHDKEKWEEFKNIFNADKKIYKIMKEQLENDEIDEIPELFEKKYPIFAVLDDHNLLDTSSEIYEYIKLLPDDNSVYIPKNIALKGLFNDAPISSISLTELKDTNNFETTIDTDDES